MAFAGDNGPWLIQGLSGGRSRTDTPTCTKAHAPLPSSRQPRSAQRALRRILEHGQRCEGDRCESCSCRLWLVVWLVACHLCTPLGSTWEGGIHEAAFAGLGFLNANIGSRFRTCLDATTIMTITIKAVLMITPIGWSICPIITRPAIIIGAVATQSSVARVIAIDISYGWYFF